MRWYHAWVDLLPTRCVKNSLRLGTCSTGTGTGTGLAGAVDMCIIIAEQKPGVLLHELTLPSIKYIILWVNSTGVVQFKLKSLKCEQEDFQIYLTGS